MQVKRWWRYDAKHKRAVMDALSIEWGIYMIRIPLPPLPFGLKL